MSIKTSAGLRLQGLPQKAQAVVLARHAADRTTDGSFSPAELLLSFDAATLPRPAKISNVVAALSKVGFVTRRSAQGRWWLTPSGKHESYRLMSEVDLQIATADDGVAGGAALGHLRHPVLPPTWAPAEIVRSLGDFLIEHPFETNVFAMTRFPTAEDHRLTAGLTKMREACDRHGLTLHLASDRQLVDDLWGNVLAHMWASQYGVALFENDSDRGINYNLTIEVGAMLLAGRRTALLKDTTVPAMPTDLVGQIYKGVDLRTPSTVSAAVHAWIRDDLRLGRCGECAAEANQNSG